MSIITKVTKSQNNANGFVIFKPDNYTTSTQYPLIIFLHDIDERGSGNEESLQVLIDRIPTQLKTAIQKTWTINSQNYRFVLLAPQLEDEANAWPTTGSHVQAMLNYAQGNLSINQQKIYLMGHGIGGGGAWKALTISQALSDRFAAAVPVCGTAGWTNLCYIASSQTGIWAFHDSNDGVIPVTNTNTAVDGINNCTPAPEILGKKTLYAIGDHAIWSKVYDAFISPGTSGESWTIYEYFLRCSQGAPIQVPIDVSIDVLNAQAGFNFTSFDGAGQLNGNASTGWTTAYWEVISAPAGTPSNIWLDGTGWGVEPEFRNLIDGTYQFQLVVSNAVGQIDTDVTFVTVIIPPTFPPPTAGDTYTGPSDIKKVVITYTDGTITTVTIP